MILGVALESVIARYLSGFPDGDPDPLRVALRELEDLHAELDAALCAVEDMG